jgi:hypothetical protein
MMVESAGREERTVGAMTASVQGAVGALLQLALIVLLAAGADLSGGAASEVSGGGAITAHTLVVRGAGIVELSVGANGLVDDLGASPAPAVSSCQARLPRLAVGTIPVRAEVPDRFDASARLAILWLLADLADLPLGAETPTRSLGAAAALAALVRAARLIHLAGDTDTHVRVLSHEAPQIVAAIGAHVTRGLSLALGADSQQGSFG